MKRRLARVVLRLTRWGTVGAPPADPAYVAVAAPHTSNWDLLYLLLHGWFHGVEMSWLAKESLFRGPAGSLLKSLGGIPVDRDRQGGKVASLASAFAATDELVVVIPPAGTRRSSDHWKSGFYRVAVAADVPIVCCYLDYEQRVGGFGPVVWPSDDIEADMAIFREFYADKHGKYRDQKSDIRLLQT